MAVGLDIAGRPGIGAILPSNLPAEKPWPAPETGAGPRRPAGSWGQGPAGRDGSLRCGSGAGRTLLDEEHLLVGRQRPEVVGDEQLELVAGGADGGHGGDDGVAGVPGMR